MVRGLESYDFTGQRAGAQLCFILCSFGVLLDLLFHLLDSVPVPSWVLDFVVVIIYLLSYLVGQRASVELGFLLV